MKKSYLILLFVIFSITGMSGQHTVRGTVVSKTDGMPVPGATVIPDGLHENGTVTDFDGNFKLVTPNKSGVVRVSYMGFATIEVKYDEGRTLTINLEEQVNSLDEVVLIGYGSSEKKDLTTAVSTVNNMQTLSSRPVSNFTEFLQGNLPGVTVSQDGGDPSAGSSIIIRGMGTLSVQAPLTVVDGVPYYGPPINPNDIESVSILKDAASASIYGAQAASGVVVIQTKEGKQGKMRINIDSFSGFQSANNLPKSLTAEQTNYAYNTAADNSGSPKNSAHDAGVNPWGAVTRTNWVDEIFRTSTLYNLNANITGSTEKVNYMTSLGYNRTDGILLGTSKDRYSFRVKSSYKLSEKVTVEENVYFSKTEAIGTNTTDGYSGSIINAIYMPSAASVYNPDGTFQGVVPNDLAQFAGAYGDVYNPVALLLRPTMSNPVNYLNANFSFKYQILGGLSFNSVYSYAMTDTKSKRFIPRVPELGRANPENYLYQSYSDESRWVWDNQVNYKESFGLHNLQATAIYSALYTNYEYFFQEGRGFGSEGPHNQYMSNATTLRPSVTDVYEDALTSAIGRVMYNYDNKYYLSGSIRRDETSRLAKGNKSDYFPSVSGALRVSDMSFFKVKAIDDLKFRGSWGEIGNIQSVGHYSFDVPLRTSLSIIGKDGAYNDNGVFVGKQSNLNLKWETTESFNFGMDAQLFGNKLSLTADYFKKSTKGMIIPGLEDAHQGTTAADVNGGRVENAGWELAANYTSSVGDFRYSLFGNMSKVNNKLSNLDGYNQSAINYIAHSNVVRGVLRPFRSEVGQELYSYFLVPYEGIFQSQQEIDSYTSNGTLIQPNAKPGDFKFRDSNNDGKIDSNDRVFMGSYLPDFTYNFGFNFNYKNFDLNTLFQGVSGAKAFNAYKYTTYNASLQGYNLDNRVLNAWTPQNTDTDIPRLATKDDNSNFGTASSWYLEDASYLRLKSVVLGYTVPDKIMRGDLEGISVRIYLSADNLFTITKYTGMDPEVGNNGLDVGRYPLSSKYVAGLTLSF